MLTGPPPKFNGTRDILPAGLQGHAAGPAYAQIRAGISELVDHAADVWVLDPLSFGEAAKGTIGPAPITNRHAGDTA